MDRLIIAFMVLLAAGVIYYIVQLPTAPAAVASAAPASPSPATPAPAAAPYHPAIDLVFTAEDGRTVDLASYRGKVVLIDFWATWCPPCRGEVPNVVAAYERYHDKGFEVIGISLDQDESELRSFTQSNGMTWPQYFDGGGWNNQMAQRFGIDSIPAMWLIGKDGQIITKNAREDLEDQVAAALDR